MISTLTEKRMTVSGATSRLINLILAMSPEEILETLQEMEERKRKAESLDLCDVVFAAGHRIGKGTASMISPKGLVIETRERFSPGEILTLAFENRKEGRPVKTTGEVVRETPSGIEVRFIPDSGLPS